jgi:aspartate/methionine/tyrosine aminotransferase
MKSTTIGIILFIVIVLVGVFFVMPGKGGTNGNAIAGTEDGVQKVVLSMKNYNYYPNTVTVNAGTPVRIYLDESVGGCYRDFTIRSFGVRSLASPNDY